VRTPSAVSLVTRITEETFEEILQVFKASSLIDLRDVTFIDPYGMVGILEIGEFFKRDGIRKEILLPKSEVVIKYLERMDFLEFADNYFF
jgi:anti-anti-sigma regulatory factor